MPVKTEILSLALGAGLALFAADAAAIKPRVKIDPAEAAVSSDVDADTRKRFDDLFPGSANVLNYRYRLYGHVAAAERRWPNAADDFRVAASYADKYSQHRLSLLYWHGVGVEKDRVQAYLWADLAAERGYTEFLAVRERMWRQLDEAERAAAVERGPALYEHYGDPAAKQRQKYQWLLGQATSLLRRERLAVVDFEDYWQKVDAPWVPPKNATVTVGEIEEVDAPTRKGRRKPAAEPVPELPPELSAEPQPEPPTRP
ncbi:MAG: sel1 repeat family protein [Lysobacter sp.]|nr:sel1 repeat family protein [Lysobacter sp.]